ncbi:MAG: universal stress protein [Pseudomonadota bacterium]
MRQFSNVLYVAPEDGTEAGLKRALSLMPESGGTLTLVSVVETMVSGTSSGRFHDELSEAFEALRVKRMAALQTLAGTVPSRIETVCEVMDGLAYMKVIERVQLYNHDLVVVHAQQEEGPLKRLFVSEEMQLLRKCPVPVLITKKADAPFTHVFASIDFDHDDTDESKDTKRKLNDSIIDIAASIADHDGAKLDIANVFTVPGEGAMVAGWIPMSPENLSDYANNCRSAAKDQLTAAFKAGAERTKLPVFDSDSAQTVLLQGRARVEIPLAVEKSGADLVVMGTVGRVGVPGFLIGNTAETILRSIECSVLALKPEGFVSPVTVS